MRVCLVATNGPASVGGLAAVVRSVGQQLADGTPIPVVCRFAQDGPRHLAYSARERARRMVCGEFDVHVVAPPAVSVPALNLAQRASHHPRLQNASREIFERAYYPAVQRAIDPGTEVVHFVGAGWEMLGFAALQAARRRGACFTVWPAMHPGTWGDSKLDARLYVNADAVFAQSHFERSKLTGIGVDPSRIVLCPCGPVIDYPGDGAAFRSRYRLDGRPLVLFLGRRQRYKGYHALLEAMAVVRQHLANACVVVAGEDLEPPYPELASDALVDLGRCDDQTKADALAACDVLCMPSAAEAFGIVYVEAWAAGKPVIGGPAPAVRELIREGVDGFCVSQSPPEIAERLRVILADPQLRDRLGTAGRLRQETEFTWERAGQIFEETFRQALTERRLEPPSDG